MKTNLLKILLPLFMLGAIISRAQGPVIPDKTFAGTGQKMFMVNGFPLSYGNDVKVLSDGKIFMSGVYRPGGNGVSFRIALVKFNPDGSIDESFGEQGLASGYNGTSNSIGGIRNRILVQDDGKIYVTGYGYSITNDMVVCRFNADGSIDSTFNGTGYLFIDNLGTNTYLDQAFGITQDNSGFLYTTGTTATNSGFPPPTGVPVAKFDTNGVFQPDFAGDGTQVYTPALLRGQGYDIAVLPDGKILVGGSAGFPASLMVMRLNPDGSYDNTFNGTGKQFVDVSGIGIANDGYSMLVQADGKILVSGAGFEGGTGKYVGSIIRLNSDGSIDNTFGGGDGISLLNLKGTYLQCILTKIIQMSDGRYLTCGQLRNPGTYDMVIARLHNDGSLDTTFNNNGYYTHDFSGLLVDDYCYGVDLQSDGKILMSGYTEIGGGTQNRFSIIRLIPDAVVSAFTPSTPLTFCQGNSIAYTNQSQGYNLTYNWIFEGGTPSTSTQANPVVAYNSGGVFSTTLIVTNGVLTDTLTYTNYITVTSPPNAPGAITGVTQMCGGVTTEYSINPVIGAESYNWQLEPYIAGTLNANGLTAGFTSSVTYNGPYTISVSAANNCGASNVAELNGNINETPAMFQLSGPGYYCEGTNGQTFTLSGSELNASYELLLNDIPTGNIKQGTGNSIMWPNITQEGFYTSRALNGCMLTMAGQIYNIMYQPPQVPATPSGETGVCNTETTSYTITAVPTANEYIWQLTPANSGTLTANGTQAQIVWNQLFTGVAKLSVSAVNECGSSPASPQLSVTVSGIPTPEISGLNKLCINTTAAYFSSGAANSSYSWSVTGGEITSGAGTNYVTINWSSSGQGIVKLTETSAQGCTGNAADFFVEVSLCTDVQTNLNNGGLSVFPNPASTVLQLELPASIEVYNLQVFSVTGDLVLNVAKPSGNYITLDVSNLAVGVYSLKVVSTDFKSYSTKFIKK